MAAVFNPASAQVLGWALLAAVVASASAGYGGYRHGVQQERTEAEARLARAMQAVADRAIEQAQADASIATKYETDRAQITAIFSRMKTEVDAYVRSHPDLNNCSLDADGLRLWTAANAGTAAEDPTGKPDGAVSDTAAAGIRPAGGPAE